MFQKSDDSSPRNNTRATKTYTNPREIIRLESLVRSHILQLCREHIGEKCDFNTAGRDGDAGIISAVSSASEGDSGEDWLRGTNTAIPARGEYESN